MAGAGSLEGQIAQKTIDDHCDCMMPINTWNRLLRHRGIDRTKSVYDCTTLSRPVLFHRGRPSTVREDKIYFFYGKPENLMMKDATGGHSYGSKEELRPEILSFFIKELKGKNIKPKASDKMDISKELSEEELTASHWLDE